MSELLTFDPRGGAGDAAIQKIMLERIGLTMPLLATLDLDAIVRCRDMTHTIMPFIDPTAYMNRTNTLDHFARLAELLKPAVEYWREEIAPAIEAGE